MKNSIGRLMIVLFMVMMIMNFTACGKSNLTPKPDANSTSDNTTSGTIIEQNASSNADISLSDSSKPTGNDNKGVTEKATGIDAAKAKQVSDFLTYKKIPNLTVTLDKLFSDDKYYSVDWIDFDTMVKLCVKRTETSNMITFRFQKVGNELDFPQVSTMITTNDGGTQDVEWSYENIDSALIELLIADGYIQDNGGYYAAK